MTHPVFRLEDLGAGISQGLSIGRYREKGGNPEPVVNVKDLGDLRIESSLEYVELNADAKIQKYRLLENDVIIAIRGSLLKSSVITVASQGSIPGQNVAVFRPENLEKVAPEYIAVLMRSRWMQNSPDVTQKKTGSTLPSIRISDLRKFNIPLPEMKYQEKIVNLYMKLESHKKIALEALSLRSELTEEAVFRFLED